MGGGWHGWIKNSKPWWATGWDLVPRTIKSTAAELEWRRRKSQEWWGPGQGQLAMKPLQSLDTTVPLHPGASPCSQTQYLEAYIPWDFSKWRYVGGCVQVICKHPLAYPQGIWVSVGIDIQRRESWYQFPVDTERWLCTYFIYFIHLSMRFFFLFQILLRHKLQPRVILWVLKLTQLEWLLKRSKLKV